MQINLACTQIMEITEKTPILHENFVQRPSKEVLELQKKNERPSSIDKKIIYSSAGCLLFAVLMERAAYHGIVGNLVLFCTNDLLYTSTVAVTINLVFTGVSYMVPLFGGRIADAVAGRYNTIYACFLMYLVGVIMLPLVSYDYFSKFGYDQYGLQYGLALNYKRGYFLFGITLAAIGAGGIKANISPFGAQQVESVGPDAVHSFFNWYYWFVNIGGCLAYLIVVYIQQEINFAMGYILTASSLFIGFIIFCIPRNFYLEHKKGSRLGHVVVLLWQGTSSQCCSQRKHRKKSVACLDYAKQEHGGSFRESDVEEMKCILKTVPIFLTLILFSTFTSQNTTTMLLQGERMNSMIGDLMIPVASLNIFKGAIVALFVPVLDLLVYPALNHFNRKPTILQRMGLGLIIGVVALVYMGVLEIFRKQDIISNGGIKQNVGGLIYIASNISILWQIPQFVLTGLAEAFSLITALEFAYTESPVSMQGMVMGMNHLTTGLGNLLGSAIYNIISAITANGDPWLPNEINDGYLEYFIFLLAGILFLNFLVFIFLAKSYKYSQLGVSRYSTD